MTTKNKDKRSIAERLAELAGDLEGCTWSFNNTMFDDYAKNVRGIMVDLSALLEGTKATIEQLTEERDTLVQSLKDARLELNNLKAKVH